MSSELTQQQYNIFKDLKLLDLQPVFKSFPQITSLIPTKSQEQISINKQKWLFYDVDYDLQHEALRQKLLNYRQKSEQIYQVGELLKDYQSKFGDLMQDKDKLIELIKGMKGETSELVSKQKKLIDLSMKMKESLDYYSYHSKFSFDYACEIASRQMFENILQQTLSELTDGIQYFQQNTTFSQSKKYLSMFQNNRSKVLSFVKSFFIKLFNKQSQFMNKNQKLTFNSFFETFYPKSKFKFISAFLVLFPQFAPKLQHILKSVKQSSNQQQLRFLQSKQLEIFQFQLNKNNQALIGYLQKNMSEIYQQSILHFITYYRTAFHQNFAKNDKKDIANSKAFNEKFIEIIYLLTSEYAYMCYCCRITSYQKAETIRSSISSLSKLYFQEFYKASKQVRNQSTFEICQILLEIKQSLLPFLNNHVKQEYQSYALGTVGESIKDPQHIQYLRSLFDLYVNKFLSEMEITCYNKFPVFQIKTTKVQVQNQVKEFLQCISKLKFCQSYAEKYLIGTLDCLVKSIKQANSKIESRFQCYVWNIELFFTIRQSLKGIKGNLIRKELKFDTNSSSNMLQKVKNIQRNESLIKYAQDLFNVIKTGMPVINQLTLDFSKYINQHCEALQSQFVKDILYIYAKNMIEFLQRFSEASSKGQEQLKAACQSSNIQALYNSYVLSIEKYTKDGQILMKEHLNYRFNESNTQTIKDLLSLIYDKLFDFMDKFYVNVSPYVTETQNFKEIEILKSIFKKCW